MKAVKALVLSLSCSYVQPFVFTGSRLRPHTGLQQRLGRSSSALSMSIVEEAVKEDKLLHVVYRVGDMDKSINFYKDVFGMQLLRYRDIKEEKYSNAFLGYGSESAGNHFALELTYNYNVTSYDMGDGFVCVGLCLPDLDSVASKAKAAGSSYVNGPNDVKFAPCVIPDEDEESFNVGKVLQVKDPDGYLFNITEIPQRRDPVSRIVLRVDNLKQAEAFYEKALGMSVLRRRSNVPFEASMMVRMGYKDEEDSTMLELYYQYATKKVQHGTAYGQIAIGTPDVYKAAEAITAAGYKVTREPGPVPGIGTKITACRDPDGYKVVLVDQADFELELGA